MSNFRLNKIGEKRIIGILIGFVLLQIVVNHSHNESPCHQSSVSSIRSQDTHQAIDASTTE